MIAFGLVALPLLAGCAESRCSGARCGARAAGQVFNARSAHYRVALRVDPVAGRELRSTNYRLRASLGPVQLEARP
jgi:hypothetical protein